MNMLFSVCVREELPLHWCANVWLSFQSAAAKLWAVFSRLPCR